ncbi:MAG: phosphoribulokinase [Gammaproteobacteria bacterium]|nr:phosphoribulokinase [Gammaproteobacteria bacterium]
MSSQYPVIAVTGSAGSGISSAANDFRQIFQRGNVNACFVHGNSFRKYPGKDLVRMFRDAEKSGTPLSAFGPEINLLNRLEGLFQEFSRSGSGTVREYVESDEQAQRLGVEKGLFSAWEEIPVDTDVLFYEGHHGGYIESLWSKRELSQSNNPLVIQKRQQSQTIEDPGVDIAQWVDLLIGIVPSINLEWMQKINRACQLTFCSAQDAVNLILRRMPDYVKFITPQFSWTDINFQRIPMVDTSNPFVLTDVPLEDECMVVVRFREPKKYNLIAYKEKFPGAKFTRPNTLLIPNTHMSQAIRTICEPIVTQLMERRKEAVCQLA